MRDFLALLEGKNNEEIETDETIEKEVEESTMHMSDIIESITTDMESDITHALEVYEMALVVGGAAVVQEGSDSSRATELVQEASDNFFGKILQKLKEIKDWFVSMVKKIINKLKTLFANIDGKWAKYEADYRKNFEPGKFKFSGVIIDFSGLMEFTTEISECVGNIVSEFINNISDPSKITEDLANSITTEGFFDLISHNTKTTIKSTSDVVKVLREKTGIDKESSDIKVSNSDSDIMIECIKNGGKFGRKSTKASMDMITTLCDATIREVSSVQKNANGDNSSIIVKTCNNITSCVNTASSVATTALSEMSTIFAQAAQSYIGFIVKVAEGKAVTESMDFSHIFENDNIDEIIEEGKYIEENAGSPIWDNGYMNNRSIIDMASNLII